jgi:uncharacterized membrane protein
MDIGFFHPQIVHFVIALLFVGVGFRLASLTGKFAFADAGAATLILLGTLAAVLAVQSGHDAHEAVERIPGIRAAVNVHEDWGERVRNIFLVVALLEILGLTLLRVKHHRALLVVSGIVGLAGCAALFEAGDKGGDLVYNYAGGPGLRSGDTTDVSRMLLAGLYNQAMADRAAGKSADAAELVGELARRYPQDTMVRLLTIESLITDRKDGKAALTALDGFAVTPQAPRFLRFRLGILRADALAAAGMPDSAKKVLQGMMGEFGKNPGLQQRMSKLK